MAQIIYWMVLSCAYMGVVGTQYTKAATALVSAPEHPVSPVTASGSSLVTAMSSTGRFILFVSSACDVVTNEPSHFDQLYLRDRDLGTTVLVSVTPAGAAANGRSIGFFVDDAGQKVVFQSSASDLARNDQNGAHDIYMRDLHTGTTTLLSASTNGSAGNGDSRYPRVTPDGLYVAFESAASDLVDNDTNQAVEVYIRDIKMGSITRASLLPDEFSTAPRRDAHLEGLSTNGQYVLFSASAAKRLDETHVARHLFLRDTLAQTTHWISSNLVAQIGGDCWKAAMTPDGRFVLFTMSFNDPAHPYRETAITFRHEMETGIATIIAINPGVVATEAAGNVGAVISDDGRFVAYTISADPNGMSNQVYRLDSLTGSNILCSVSTNGVTAGNSASDSPQISADGRMVLFATLASDIVPQPTSGDWNFILRDMDTGLSRLVSINKDGTSGAGGTVGTVCMTPDCRLIAFDSQSAMIVAGDPNNERDVFVRNMDADATELISIRDPRQSSATVSGLHNSSSSSISSDGRYVVFSSSSDLLAAGDTNLASDAFIRDTVAGTTTLITWNESGTGSQNSGLVGPPSVTHDGRFVMFSSISTNLSSADTNRSPDVYVRDLWNGTNMLVSKNVLGLSAGGLGSVNPWIAPNGHYVLYTSRESNMVQNADATQEWCVYERDIQLGTNFKIASTYGFTVMSASHDGQMVVILSRVFDLQSRTYCVPPFSWTQAVRCPSISGDGQRFAYATSRLGTYTWQLNCFDVTKQTNLATIPLGGTPPRAIRLNHDGSKVAYEMLLSDSSLTGRTQVYVWDAATGSNILVSVNMNGQPAQGRSTLVDITPDGNRIVFNSDAEDLVATDHNGWTDVYVRDLAVNQTRLLSENRRHTGSGNGLSVATALSGDGNSVVFYSAASDLIANDLNGAVDIFVRPIIDASEFQITGLVRQPDASLRLTWAAVPGRTYRLQFKDTLDDVIWNDLAGDIVSSDASAQADVASAYQDSRYFRVVLVK